MIVRWGGIGVSASRPSRLNEVQKPDSSAYDPLIDIT